VAGVPRRTLDIHVSGDASLRAAMAPDALKQVLLNLVQNSREAAGSGAPAPGAESGVVVTMAVSATPGGVRVEVGDNGPGVPVALRERIFDPFFSTKSAVQGVGLGLFVAEGLVRGAGGRLSVTQGALGGAAFVLELPAATDAVPETAGGAPVRDVAGTAPPVASS
jgi:C4-dicarboxylate-specific signal transduction histidine kinase